MPRLVIILPVRNAEKTIESAVRSTLRVLPPDSQLYIFDDGSTDRTLDVLERIQDRRIEIMTGGGGAGVAGGLNALMNISDSEFLGRMDADDVCLPGRFKAQMSALKKGVDLVFGGILNFGDGFVGVRPSTPRQFSAEFIQIALMVCNPVAHSTMLGRRSAITAVGGYRECRAEDYDLWLRLAIEGGRLIKLARPVLAYRHHLGQVTAEINYSKSTLAEVPIQESRQGLAHLLLGEESRDPQEFQRRFMEVANGRAAWQKRYLLKKARSAFAMTEDNQRFAG